MEDSNPHLKSRNLLFYSVELIAHYLQKYIYKMRLSSLNFNYLSYDLKIITMDCNCVKCNCQNSCECTCCEC